MATTMQENLARHLSDSIERLQKQVEQVEFWASAVTGFTQPVPGYEPETSSVARYVKPGRPTRKRRRRRAANQNDRREAGAFSGEADTGSPQKMRTMQRL
jgi:hypothetical protein